MKKFLSSALLVLVALTSAMADGFSIPIGLTKNPLGSHNSTPGIKPHSLTGEDDSLLSLEAILTDDAILLSASSATFARISVVSESGTVVYDQMDILGNEPTEIATLGWLSGSYTLYIEVGDDLYEGSFEL